MNGASLLLAAFKWMLVVWPARLPCEWVSSPAAPWVASKSEVTLPRPCEAEAKVGLGEGRGEVPQTLLPALGFKPSSILSDTALALYQLGLSSGEHTF